MGTWEAGKGLEVSQPQMFERRKDLSGVTIVNTLLPWNPICIMHEHENGTLYDASGLFLGALIITLLASLAMTRRCPSCGPQGTSVDNCALT